MFQLGQFLKKYDRPLIMGIVNATGDSFSEGGGSAAESALDRALRQLDDGADLLDIGGESTRPGAREIPVAEELARVIPLVREIKRLRPQTVLSIDTRKSEVAHVALEAGAEIINDVSMLRYDPALAAVTASGGGALVLNHSRGTPGTMRNAECCTYGNVIAEVTAELAAAAEKAVEAGVARENIIFDPGFGFAKNAEQDWEILRNIAEFRKLGTVLAGISRKSFLGKFLNQPDPQQRFGGTAAGVLYLADAGTEMIRVHDVRQVRDVLAVHRKLRSGE